METKPSIYNQYIYKSKDLMHVLPCGTLSFYLVFLTFFYIKFFNCNPIIYSNLFLLSHIWPKVDNDQTIVIFLKKITTLSK